MSCVQEAVSNGLGDQLDQNSIFRYSRQLIMPEIGMAGQQALRNSSILVVGAGGLGCPVAQYLAAAGVGKIGIVDYDEVELSNLHRQILHTEEGVRKKTRKASSVAEAVNKLNSTIKVEEYCLQLNGENALPIIEKFDVIVDATDNVPSRYLVNDLCVIANKPLVSGSALRWEGQLTVYHYKSPDESEHGPCYRCLYPQPPPPDTVTNCSDGGVLGVVPGIIGCIQALETIKIVIGIKPSYHKQMLLFDGLTCAFKNIKLRGKQANCIVCGRNPTITREYIPHYEEFCKMSATDKCRILKILPADQRLTVFQYKDKFVDQKYPHILLDVRQPVEIDICSLPNSVNLPIKALEYCKAKATKHTIDGDIKKILTSDNNLKLLDNAIKKLHQLRDLSTEISIVVVCKQGNDSQKAVDILQRFVKFDNLVKIYDIIGGLMSWASKIDTSFTRY